jgi:hypothetical protein
VSEKHTQEEDPPPVKKLSGMISESYLEKIAEKDERVRYILKEEKEIRKRFLFLNDETCKKRNTRKVSDFPLFVKFVCFVILKRKNKTKQRITPTNKTTHYDTFRFGDIAGD